MLYSAKRITHSLSHQWKLVESNQSCVLHPRLLEREICVRKETFAVCCRELCHTIFIHIDQRCIDRIACTSVLSLFALHFCAHFACCCCCCLVIIVLRTSSSVVLLLMVVPKSSKVKGNKYIIIIDICVRIRYYVHVVLFWPWAVWYCTRRRRRKKNRRF